MHAKYLLLLLLPAFAHAQKKQAVEIKRVSNNRIDVMIGKKEFTSFLFPDTLEKPVLYPVRAANGVIVTRGFPLNPRPGDPTDHPHHIGIWFNFENVNGLDFWNNSFAIPKERKHLYGWIKTDSILRISGDSFSYHANWVNQGGSVLLEEITTLAFSGTENLRIIDRTTTLKADTTVLFKDAKDGMLGIRVRPDLQIPDEKTRGRSTGNYITSEGKQGDSAWSTRAAWCKLYGKIGPDSLSISVLDHPKNINYPTYWHARGYGLFAANPLAANVFTNGKTATNLTLQKGEAATFRYRIVIQNGKQTISPEELNKLTPASGQ